MNVFGTVNHVHRTVMFLPVWSAIPHNSKHDTLRDIVLERIRAVNEYIRSNVDGYIKKIVVFAPDKSSSRRHQKVKIYFNFVDDVEIPIISETITTETTYGRRKTS